MEHNILFITTTPTKAGNGDTLIETAMETMKEQGINVRRIDIRNKHIGFCKACYGCSQDGVCVQKDDFAEILAAIHNADGIIAEAPVYYNCMSAQALTVINRLCCTFACKSYKLGPKKKIAVFLTCTGSDVIEMKHHVDLILTLPSLSRAITAYRTEVFTNCNSDTTCLENATYLERVKTAALWVAGEK